ncbi:hypothetical protein XM38_004180 [Halomicronema hongdechloris C2206]|uniref:Chromosome partition protein Smc n=1 Tax=Halomicronema hongdechloris C2206 TaxID=1641165 RepID=A0A1V8NFR5_9CYAN|nr:hypothetical protein [Halomicronema hongdechloris]ASC69491.1 hypothetical protein XM38_004180 [Halomicronema hongdechloris C2206]
MPSKSQLQATLKEKYGINKNITQRLSAADCENLLNLLDTQSSAERLVEVFVDKNNELSNNNRYFGQRRSQAEKKFERLQAEHHQLQKSIAELEAKNNNLGERKQGLFEEQQALEAEINKLTSENRNLSVKVQSLTTHNDELVTANDQLKKDNKELKNIVDQIRLRLARDTKLLLQYEDSEIRKALIRLFRWTLG